MILPDSPITKKDKDLLNRFPLAEKISELIKNHQNDESFVIGIEGRWGSGKTSFVNLIRQELKDNVFMINFNPWNFTGQNELIEDFFASLISVLHTSDTEDEDIKKIKKYALKLTKKSEVSFSPEVSLAGGLINFKAGELFKFFAEKNLEEVKEKIIKGDPFSRALSVYPDLYPSIYISIITTGEETGSFTESFKYLADFFSSAITEKTKKIPVVLEPVILIFIGLFVAFVASAIILPIYKVTEGLY